MAKAKSKSKFDFKQFLLKKGEYLAMGIAGFFLFVLMVWGITKGRAAPDPDAIAKNMVDKSKSVQSQVASTQATEDMKQQVQIPEWVAKESPFKRADVRDFPLSGPPFDPTAKPDTKKENPNVLPIGTYAGAYQVDLIKGSMKAFDVIQGKDGEQIIAVIYDKKIESQDKDKVKNLLRRFKGKKEIKKKQGPGPMAGGGPMGGGLGGLRPGGGGGSLGGPPGGLGGQRPGGGGGSLGPGPMGGGGSLGGPPGQPYGGGMGNPYGGGGEFNQNSQRIEKAIEYIPIAQIDAALQKNKVPAMTVVPVRMVTIHAEIPLKQQINEIRRALRLNSTAEAARWGPVYDGFDVRRKVISYEGGKEVVVQDWADYDFEEEYRNRIHSLREADHFDDGYLGYFMRYEMALALPLPELVTETGARYPDMRLTHILETIKKLEAASKAKEEPSDIRKRLTGGSSRSSLYMPQGAEGGAGGMSGGGMGMGGAEGGPLLGPLMGGPKGPTTGGAGGSTSGKMFTPGDAKNNPYLNAPEIEHLLLRFVDPAVQPGMTYQYQIRLRMKNPNYKHTTEVSKPSDAEKEFLDSPWVTLADQITIPSETFVYSADWSAYTKKIKEEHEKERELQRRLEAKDYQAVVETVSWMEQVRTGDGGKREPVGAWVVADYPVGRGEYIGRKTYVKLPLWSSETNSYVLREVPDKVIPKIGAKEPAQPKGWLMDFTNNRSILVDFEGGKVRTRIGSREVTEEVATEMLVLRPDGKLVVKRSTDAENDPFRKAIVADWDKWVKEVEARKTSSGDDSNGFSPRPGGGSPIP